jgi:hypothetical protein
MKKLCFLFACLTAVADPKITWDPNTEPDLGGYRIYYGPTSRGYTNFIEVAALPGVQITNTVPIQGIKFVAVNAFNTNGLESDFSNEITLTNRPAAPGNVKEVVMGTSWLLRTNKSTPVSYTPVAVVQTIPGTSISATIAGPWGSLNRTATASLDGNAQIVGKAVIAPSLITLNATRATVPLAVVETAVLP